MQERSTLFYCPNTGSYAVIRMDPVAMVQHLNDNEALAEARKMSPKSYLVYLKMKRELPFPNRPWYRLLVCPIGTSLRPADESQGITSDMCVPIYPNTSHPSGRKPIHTKPIFPFKTCYHWLSYELDIRVRARPEWFDERHMVQLGVEEQMNLDSLWTEDVIPLAGAQTRVRPAEGAPARKAVRSDDNYHNDYDDSKMCRRDNGAGDHARASWSCESLTDSFVSGVDSDNHTEDSVDAITAMNIFGGPDQDLALVPLVELWLNLNENLKECDIPNPQELFEEHRTITKIIQDSRTRAYKATSGNPQSGSVKDGSKQATPTKQPRVRPRKLMRKLSTRVGAYASHVSRILCLPYVAVWP